MQRLLPVRALVLAALVVGAAGGAVSQAGILGGTSTHPTHPRSVSTLGAAFRTPQHHRYRCTFPKLGNRSILVDVTLVAPPTVPAGSELSVSDIQVDPIVPAGLTGPLIRVLGTSLLHGTVDHLDVLVDNFPAVINAAATDPGFATVALVRGKVARLALPSSAATAGPFTAGPSGTIRVTVGDVTLVVGSSRGPRSIVCIPAGGSSALASVLVSGPTPQGTPTITGIVPRSGSPSGGTRVVITGTGFSVTSTGFAFGPDDLATLVTCGSSTSCSALTPPGRGTATVVAVANGFPSAPDPPGDRFHYSPSS